MSSPTTTTATAPETRRPRRLLGWGAVIGAFVLVGIVGAVLADASSWTARGALDPESAGPDGARAVARVLEQHGVDVRVVRDREAARAAVGEGVTLVLGDNPALSDADLADLADAAGTVVLVEPRSASLDALLPGSELGGYADLDEIAPECDDPDARRAGDIVAGAGYTAGPGIVGCYPVDDGFALLRASEDGDRVVWALDGRALFANDTVDQAGNAAVALAVLGARPTLVWYMPSLGDAAGEGAPTLGELTPSWVSPAVVLLIFAAIVAGLWRGRRFGPLVAENLPVTVRASETSTGRGRLYAAARDAPHALDQLRRATRRRLAATLGLSPLAGPREVADAAAARLGDDRASVHDILIDAVAHDDRSLVALDERLRDLEARVRAAVRPEGTTP